jgi:hypothetical protein
MKHLVPIHVANYVGSPGSVQPGFKKFYLKNGYFKLYDGTNENDVVLDRPLDGFTPLTGTITAADSVLTALEKLQNAISSFGGITGSGTPNRVSKFFTSTTIGDSLIEDNGASIVVNRPNSFATPFRFDVNGTIYCDYGTSNVANVPSTLYVNMPFYNLSGGTPDALIVKINGKALPANGTMTGYNVQVSGPDNSGFYGDFDDTSALSEGIRLNSRPLHTGNFINFVKYTGVIGNTVFRVNNTGDTITNKILVGTATDPGFSVKAAITNGHIAIDNNRHFISYRPDGLPLSIFKINTSNQLEFNPTFGQSLTAYLFTINGSERMRITQAGDVGMGTNSPSQKLHVSGNARITGAVYDSANSPGTAGQILSSTLTGTAWITSPASTIGTWGTLNYPTWVSGTPFVTMTAAGTFALDNTSYYPSSNPAGFITSSVLSGYVPTSRTLTINGVTYDLSADRSWTIATSSSPLTTKGDLYTFSTVDTRLPVGTDGQILVANSSVPEGLSWQDNYADWTSTVKHIVKNNGLSGTITKGTAVYVTSSNGTNMLVGRASNTSEATSSKTMGLMQSDITTTGGTQTGFVITEGLLGGLNTASATAGDPVWLGVNGALIYGLINKPYAPAHLVFIGIVTKVSNGNGEIFVKVQNGFELREIHDVDLISNAPTNGQVLTYNATSGLWIPTSPLTFNEIQRTAFLRI